MSARFPLTESFEWHGSTVRWARFGEGRPVVLCHGTPWSSFVWRATVDTLSHDRSVYVWDMVGYGQSDKPEGDVSLGTQGLLLAALVDAWQIEAPDVIAHDFGGTVCLRAHLLHDMGVSSLALVDVVALRPWGSPFFRLVADHPDVFAALPPNLHEALLREYIGGASSPGLRAEVLEELVAPWIGDGQAAFYRQIAQADERYTAEAERRYGDIDVPTLIVWGSADTWIPIDTAHKLASVVGHSTLEIIEGAGHLVQEDQPAELNAILRRWLDSGPR